MKLATPIQYLGEVQGNYLHIKREDLIPYSFGGNKVRKGIGFFEKIDSGDYDCVITYGSSHSNHCRIIANMAAARKMRCVIISPLEVSDSTFNSKFMELFGAKIITVSVENVHDIIERTLQKLIEKGYKPYFIPGGGHGNIGTEAYVQCYREIKNFEKSQNIRFDYIFFASGTGTTHAGLVCGQLIHRDRRKIIGISIARKNPRGRSVVVECIHEYFSEKGQEVLEKDIQDCTVFIDDYIGDGYGIGNVDIEDATRRVMIQFGIPLDTTYTGKAFWGMEKFLQKQEIKDKNILFIHTGGTPLFFDDLGRL